LRSAWLTPATTDVFGNRELDGKRSGGLNTQGSNWSTPTTSDSEGISGGPNRRGSLKNDSKGWMTPSAVDGNRGDYTLENGDKESPQDSLQGQAKKLTKSWPTPRAEDSEQTGRSADRRSTSPPDNLPEMIRSMWPTPDAHLSNDGESPESWLARKALHAEKEENATRAGMPLAIAAQMYPAMYPTPAARDAKGANSKEHVTTNGTGAMHMDQLPNFVEHSLPDFSRPDPKNTTTGEQSSTSTRRLNPRFVEWLMGWPIAWTDCDAPATAFIPYKLRWRSYLFGRSF
jgi:hypothetical protein